MGLFQDSFSCTVEKKWHRDGIKITVQSLIICGSGLSHATTFHHATHHRGLVFALYHLSCLRICEQKAWLC
jgi:hypothetical protein